MIFPILSPERSFLFFASILLLVDKKGERLLALSFLTFYRKTSRALPLSRSLDQSPPPLPPPFVNVPKGHRGGRGNGTGPEDAHQAKHVVQDHRQHHPHHDAVEQAGGQGEHGVARPHGQGVVDHEAGVEDLS